MARPLRIEYAGAVYHLTSRGNARKNIFADDSDRTLFMDTLSAVVKRYNWLCHAYCLMDNHYHLMIETPDPNLSMGMRHLNGIYTQRYNRRHKRPGHLFQGRFKAILVEKENYLLELCRYVVLNPVRARMLETPEQWAWSSYRATAGFDIKIDCLTTEWIVDLFSQKRNEAQKGISDLSQRECSKRPPGKNFKGRCCWEIRVLSRSSNTCCRIRSRSKRYRDYSDMLDDRIYRHSLRG